jgi:hypothetical protein
MWYVSLQLICHVYRLVTGSGTAPLFIRNQSDGPEVKVGPTTEMLKSQCFSGVGEICSDYYYYYYYYKVCAI